MALNLVSHTRVFSSDHKFLIPSLRAFARTELELATTEPEFLALARITSALVDGTCLLLSESRVDVEVAGEGVWAGVQGEGGPLTAPLGDSGNLGSSWSVIT